MKKLKILLILTLVTLLLGACSQDKKAAVKINDKTKPFITEYDKTLRSSISDINKILLEFNQGLDSIYTKQSSNEQFAQLLVKNINDSSKLVRKVESVDIDPQLFQQHQTLIVLVNRSHQLLLNAVDQAKNEDEINKNQLREEYVSIKQEEENIANQWKILMQNLEAKENKK